MLDEENDYYQIYDINKQLKSQGYSEEEIAGILGILPSILRQIIRDINNEIRIDKMIRALELKEQGYGSRAIGREMEINESSVRSLLEESKKLKYRHTIETKRMRSMFDAGYDYLYIANRLGCDENHVKWVLCDKETITPVILQMAEELLHLNLATRKCTSIQIWLELRDYHYDSYNITEELIDYIVLSNGYTKNGSLYVQS